MRRYGNLYHLIASESNIRLAMDNASKGKAYYREVVRMRKDPVYYQNKLQELLENKTFRNAEYKRFHRIEGGKEREIFKLPFFPDRILHHAICQVLEPIWRRTLIRDTYGSVPGRGIHDGVKRIKKALKDRHGTQYCLKLDIKKYFPSIDNTIMKQLVRQKIKCRDTLWLLDEIIDSTDGLPIGNYLSQHLSNLYLNGFDHYCKEQLRSRYYYRYCDDIVVLSDYKAQLHRHLKSMQSYLAEELNLQVKPNWQVFPVASRGIDFLGYRFYHGYTILRKSLAKRYKRKMRAISRSGIDTTHNRSSVMSYRGWMKYANCYNLQNQYTPSIYAHE